MWFLEQLKDNLSQLDILTMDFENASAAEKKRSTRKVPQYFIECFFHFYQCLYREVVELGFSVEYREDKNFNLNIRTLSLAVSPPNYTQSCLKMLQMS